jgi:hypothetical protein
MGNPALLLLRELIEGLPTNGIHPNFGRNRVTKRTLSEPRQVDGIPVIAN